VARHRPPHQRVALVERTRGPAPASYGLAPSNRKQRRQFEKAAKKLMRSQASAKLK
jgi:hypothetical protein